MNRALFQQCSQEKADVRSVYHLIPVEVTTAATQARQQAMDEAVDVRHVAEPVVVDIPCPSTCNVRDPCLSFAGRVHTATGKRQAVRRDATD